MYRNNESISGDFVSQSIALNTAINEWQKETEVLVCVKPRSLICGYIHCSVDCLQLLADGTIKLQSFRCVESTDHTTTPYHILIPGSDLHDWHYSNGDEFPALMFAMKKDSVLRVKCALGMNDGFTNENRCVVCALNQPLDRLKYMTFMSALVSKGVQISAIDAEDAKRRYNCAATGQPFTSLTAPTVMADESATNAVSESQHRIQGLTTGGNPLVTDISQLMSRLLSGKFAPKRVLFGAYECSVSTIKFTAFKDITFFNVKQNNTSDERFETIVIEMADIETLLMCLDVNLPSIFIKVNPICGTKIQIPLHLRPHASNQSVFDVNSRSDGERYVKVVFADYRHHNWCFLNILMYNRRSNTLTTHNISPEEALRLLTSSQSSM